MSFEGRLDFIVLVYTHYRSTVSRQQQKTSIVSPQSHPLGIQAGVHLARNQSPARLHSEWTDLSPLWRLNEVSTAIETCNHGHYEAPALSSGGYALCLLLPQRCPVETGLKLSLTSIWTSCSSTAPPLCIYHSWNLAISVSFTWQPWSDRMWIHCDVWGLWKALKYQQTPEGHGCIFKVFGAYSFVVSVLAV